jgi:hypothetical protein
MTRPRAADDFATIRARIEELRRERDQRSPEQTAHSRIGARSDRRDSVGETEGQDDWRGLLPARQPRPPAAPPMWGLSQVLEDD